MAFKHSYDPFCFFAVCFRFFFSLAVCVKNHWVNLITLLKINDLFFFFLQLSRNVSKRTFGNVRPTKTQISLLICEVW